MPSTGPRGKNWCFTLNNYTQADLDRLSSPLDGVDYIIYGKEVGQSGTPHLQGVVCFAQRKRKPQVLAVLGQCHVELARMLREAIEYCKKEGDWSEYGQTPYVGGAGNGQGRRSDIEDRVLAFKSDVKSGIRDEAALREKHSVFFCSSGCAKFASAYLADTREEVQVI